MQLNDEEFYKTDVVNKLVSSFKIISPLVAFLRNAIEQ
jgi:hypothetical protein